MSDVVIVDAVRSAIGKRDGALALSESLYALNRSLLKMVAQIAPVRGL